MINEIERFYFVRSHSQLKAVLCFGVSLALLLSLYTFMLTQTKSQWLAAWLEDMKHLEKRRKEDNCTNSGWHFHQQQQQQQQRNNTKEEQKQTKL